MSKVVCLAVMSFAMKIRNVIGVFRSIYCPGSQTVGSLVTLFCITGLKLICLMTAAGYQFARDHSNVSRNHVRLVRKSSFFLTTIGQDLHDTVQHMLDITSLPLLRISPKH